MGNITIGIQTIGWALIRYVPVSSTAPYLPAGSVQVCQTACSPIASRKKVILTNGRGIPLTLSVTVPVMKPCGLGIGEPMVAQAILLGGLSSALLSWRTTEFTV